MSPVIVRRPTNDLVAVAYLRLFSGIPSDRIATSLPTDSTGWKEGGFLTVATGGGSPHPDLPQRAPVLRLDGWAVKGRWNEAGDLLEHVIDYFDGRVDSTPFDVKENYARARVLDGRVLTEPRKIENDPSLFARFTLDLLLNWTGVAS